MKREIIGRILGIIAWGLIAFAVLVAILKWLGVIASPAIIEIFLTAVLAELLRIEYRFGDKFKEYDVKLNLVWSDFRKRKEL